jgi:DNA-binding winged helix-turn-helix (wHTH) protein
LTGRVRFGPFEANLDSGELWREGAVVPLQDLPFRLLTALVRRPGEVVSRAELSEQLWGSETFVDAAAGLNTAVAKLREALGDDPDRPQFIETVPKRGYRFVGAVEPVRPAMVEPVASAETISNRAPAARHPRRLLSIAATVAAALAVAGFAAYQLRASHAQIRVAVVLFDNETGRPELAPFAQGLTDATVTALTAEPRLAVIGNAAILRTARPFRDIAAVRDALGADYLVIGQVQSRDGGTIVRAHLIRAQDQAHLWVDVASLTDAGEAALQSDIAGRIRAALAARALASR